MSSYVLIPGACHGAWCYDWPAGSPMAESYRRVRQDPAWEVHALDSKHDLMRDVPEELASILLGVARR